MSVHTALSIWASCFLFTSSKHLCLSSGALQVKGGPYLGRFTGFFHAGKNKQNTPERWERRKKGTEFYPAAAQWCKVPGWVRRREHQSQEVLEKLSSSVRMHTPSSFCSLIHVTQCYHLRGNLLPVTNAAIPPLQSTRLLYQETDHCIWNIFQ